MSTSSICRRCRYLFVAIDRATRWVYLEVRKSQSAKEAQGFLQNLKAKVPFHIQIILTDNGKAFTDRFTCQGERKPTGEHLFYRQCKESGIDYRLISVSTSRGVSAV